MLLNKTPIFQNIIFPKLKDKFLRLQKVQFIRNLEEQNLRVRVRVRRFLIQDK